MDTLIADGVLTDAEGRYGPCGIADRARARIDGGERQRTLAAGAVAIHFAEAAALMADLDQLSAKGRARLCLVLHELGAHGVILHTALGQRRGGGRPAEWLGRGEELFGAAFRKATEGGTKSNIRTLAGRVWADLYAEGLTPPDEEKGVYRQCLRWAKTLNVVET